MRRSRLFVVAILAAWAIAPAAAQPPAQERPNFSGIWHLVEDRSIARQQGEPVVVSVWPSPVRMRQGRERLIVAIDSEQPIARSYRLDGQPSINTLPGTHGDRQTVSRATWTGATLVITERSKDETDEETVRRLMLNADGTLSVEAPWGDGGTFVASVYVRSR